ncbi:MAG: OmpA family protein [Prevotella sp.]|nr:OmpA family protein [Prevotella sp.]
MRTKYISIVAIILCMFVTTPTANAGIWKALGRIGNAIVGAAVGYAEKEVEKYVPEEQRETLHGITDAFASEIGVSSSYTNAGRNWAEGKKTDAVLDLGEGVTSDAGINSTGVQIALDIARAQNDYNNDIKSGMSQEEAIKKRNEKFVQGGMDLYDEYMVGSEMKNEIAIYEQNKQYREEKEWERAYTAGIYHALLKRGYSSYEARMYLNIIEKSDGLLRELSYDMSTDINSKTDSIDHMTNRLLLSDAVQYEIEKMLNDLNIKDRREDANLDYSNVNLDSSTDANSFFGTPATEQADINIVEPPIEASAPVVIDEHANAIKAITETVLAGYAINDVELSDDQKANLDQVAANMNKFEDICILILGHTCSLGTQKVNKNIGEQRAKTAQNYLITKGIPEKRIQIESRDSQEPIMENDTEEHRKENRRVTFKVN